MREAWKKRLWIVDGHNAIFAIPRLSARQLAGERQEARRGLEAMLAPFAGRLLQPMIIVYDGNRLLPNPDASDTPQLRTLYSQPPEEADDRIAFLAGEALRRGGGVTVVSNDRRSLGPRLPAGALQWSIEEFVARCLLPARAEESEGADEARRAGPPGGEGFEDLEAHFLARGEEIERRARERARRLERDARTRWEARVGDPRAAEARLREGGRAERSIPRAAEYREREFGAAAAPGRPPASHDAGGLAAAAAEAAQRERRETERRQEEAECRRKETERETKRRRGERAQARRLAQRASGKGKPSRRKH